MNNYEDICITLEGGLPPELFGVKNRSLLQVQAAGDLDSYFRYLIKQARIDSWDLDLEACREELKEETFPLTGVEIVEKLLKTYRDHHKPTAKIVLYKGVPFLPWMAEDILQNFPEARIIHLMRDPRAVYNSQNNLSLPYENRDFVYNPYQTIYEWKKALKTTHRTSSNRLISVQYEDLILQPDKTQRRIRSFIGASDLQSSQNNFSAKIPDDEQQLHTHIDAKPKEERIYKWEQTLKRNDIAMIELGLAGLLEACGYSEYIEEKTSGDYLRLWKSYLSYRGYIFWHRAGRILKGIRKDPKSYFIKFKSRFL